ncbi:hypothetical protein [Stenotrophomonas maltophilia]|uniref:hypothetical protein n=1 Tax=Stenotrophomonas maltophilia TaxID=40324 RepID=UPI0013DC14A8|nr:hypothetical protein [Stenotrophomonas maltophilia]
MADAEFERMLHQQQTESALKYGYFLLAAAGAGIGFVVQKLEGQHFDVPGTLCLAGAAMWLLSMVLGCLALECEVKLKQCNLEIVQLYRGSHASGAKGPDAQAAIAMRKKWYDDDRIKSGILIRWQKFTLLLGIGAIIAWRSLEMLH